MQEVTLTGHPRERGCQLGQALGGEIRALLADGVARLEPASGRPVDRAALAPLIQEHAALVKRSLPDIAAEVSGLAEGAGISQEDAWLLQLRRELLATLESWHRPRAATDCSTAALRSRSGDPVVAQTVDLPRALSGTPVLLRIQAPGEPAVMMLTFPGLLGYLGVNSEGLAVGINMVLSDGWAPGVPPYLLVRRLLSLRGVDACLEELQRLPRASSRCFTLLDARRSVQVETTCRELRVLEGPALFHTNHYLHPDLQPGDRLHPLLRRSSRARLRRLEARSAPDALTLDGEALLDVFADHSGDAPEAALCLHGREDLRSYETAAAVAIFPRLGRMHVRPGPPCTASTSTWSFDDPPPRRAAHA